jgi:hypothetical protein
MGEGFKVGSHLCGGHGNVVLVGVAEGEGMTLSAWTLSSTKGIRL